MLTCHWYVTVPAATTVKVASAPTHTVCGVGWVVIDGAAPGDTINVTVVFWVTVPATPWIPML